MKVVFKDTIVLESFTGVSKKGNEYGRLKFLSNEADVYDVFVNSDNLEKLAQLTPKQHHDLTFDLMPAYRGGVELIPAW